MTETISILPLEDCFQRLIRINHAIKDPKQAAEVYTAAVGLFCHLKKEQRILYGKAETNEPCPPLVELRAMTAVLSDPRLFASLIRCLNVPPPESDSDRRNIGSLRGNSGTAAVRGGMSRKRTMSVDEGPSKTAKTNTALSPMVSAKQKMSFDKQEISLPIQLITASILYTSLQHIDHWPAPLIHAYAEDAFGPRLWVDRKECQLLVANLQLAHENDCSQGITDDMLTEAEKVGTYYAKMMLNIPSEVPSPIKSTSLPSSQHTSLSRQTSEVEPAFPDDSDSGEEEIVEVSMGSVVKPSASRGGDDSSSSGEEEVVVASAPSFDQGEEIQKPRLDLYPVQPKKVNLKRIRPRYFGNNKDLAFASIASALEGRLEMKSKQNSRLLQTLPEFSTVPGVRSLTAKSLEKWLQSPALSGAARTLFSSTVRHIKNCDPPVPEDLETIDAILGMQLKANQLNMHIENVTEMAKVIPTATVSRYIFVKLLRKEISSAENTTQASEHLQMVAAVHNALSKSLRNDGLASAILTMLGEQTKDDAAPTRLERNRLVRKIRQLLRRLFTSLGSLYFDGCGLLESLLSFDFNPASWSARDEEDKGRIILECVTLQAPHSLDDGGPIRGKSMKKVLQGDTMNGLSAEEASKFRKTMLVARKLLITWCVMDYAPLWQEENKSSLQHKSIMSRMLQKKRKETVIGAGVPDFTSILNDEEALSQHSACPDVMKCVLFMVDPESQEMQNFLYPEGPPQQGDATWNEEIHRIKQCYQYGADLDDQALSIILASAASGDSGIQPSLALSLIEHLFECCKIGRSAELKVKDANLVWEMYKLIEYHPDKIPETLASNETEQEIDPEDQFANADELQDAEMENTSANGQTNGKASHSFPRLAPPGHWWRVTALALVMTGASPDGIGTVLADQHPTLRELIKMVTSGRYRFPTVDCDEQQRDEMKKGESSMRQQESDAAELLFLSPLPKPKSKREESFVPHGSRASSRQRERQERVFREKREKEAAEALVLENKRKRMLKVAQKSIMIWDPKGPARKPPKESVNLILSVEKLFGLSEVYQKSVEPDLIQAAIGGTSRGAIERAYDWLIPIISSMPSVINRLPASASCFLLLRVHGTESEGNTKLRELSAPLLQHVRKTVTGGFGEGDAVRASNLLLADLTCKKPAQRRCARGVLEETFSVLNQAIEDKSFDTAKCTWLRSLLLVDCISVLLPDAIKHISEALRYERGRVLRAFILSLNDYIHCAAEKGIIGDWNFSSSLCDLISSRHNVCSEAFDRYPDLRQLAISIIHTDFISHLQSKSLGAEGDEELVEFTPCKAYQDGKHDPAQLPLSLLKSTCVLLSIWTEAGENGDSSKELVKDLSNILMNPYDSPQSVVVEADGVEGVASASIVGSGQRAVSVDEWVMLAKSRSDYIARRAALSAPTKFLPRLLLCSGLPKSSLLTMIDRLGKLGEKSANTDKVYRELLMPSATLDWGFGQIGTRREIARKLIGRLSAYISMSGNSLQELAQDSSFTFINWLSTECQPSEKMRKGKPLKKAIKAGLTVNLASQIADAESLLTKIDQTDDSTIMPLDCETSSSMGSFKPFVPSGNGELHDRITESNVEQLINDWCSRAESETLERWIQATFFSEQHKLRSKKSLIQEEPMNKLKFAVMLLEISFCAQTNSEWNRVVERWIPVLSCGEGSPKLWKAIFSHHESELNIDCMVTACCATWCASHCIACRNWIFEHKNEWNNLSLQQVVTFLLQTSGQNAVHAPLFQRDSSSISPWLEDKGTVDGLIAIAYEAAKQAEQANTHRNDVTAWLHLILLVTQAGKRQANHVVSTILNKVEDEKDDTFKTLMGEAILRIYAYFPSHINLGNPKLRTVLVGASKSIDWRPWRTPMDGTLDDMLNGLKASPNQRLVHGLVEISKTHPLILLRKLGTMADILENDAGAGTKGVSRVRVQGEDVEGNATAVFRGSEIKVIIRHWGYSYTDPLWTSFLEILLSVPTEVLFPCGLVMGLKDFLATYLRLLAIQCELREKPTRLTSRFNDLIKLFEKDPAWSKWLVSFVPGLDSQNVRKLLVRCKLMTSDEAMELVKAQNT